jgi:hypothetical protein
MKKALLGLGSLLVVGCALPGPSVTSAPVPIACDQAGDVEAAADGCNTCTCGANGQWQCTVKTCGSTCPLPVAAHSGGEDCTASVVWAKDADTEPGLCCQYSGECAAPAGWTLYNGYNDCNAPVAY